MFGLFKKQRGADGLDPSRCIAIAEMHERRASDLRSRSAPHEVVQGQLDLASHWRSRAVRGRSLAV